MQGKANEVVLLIYFIGAVLYDVECIGTTMAPSIDVCISKGCEHRATCTTRKVLKTRTPSVQYVQELIKCFCTAGFTGTYCETSIFPDYKIKSEKFNKKDKLKDVQADTLKVKEALDDQVEQHFNNLTETVTLIPDIQLNNFERAIKTRYDNKNDKSEAKKMVDHYQNIFQVVYNRTEGFYKDTYELGQNTTTEIILNIEKSLIKVYELYLRKCRCDKAKFEKEDLFSNTVMRRKGKDLPYSIETKFGDLVLPYWETFQDKYEKKYVAVIVLSYPKTPYFFAENADTMNSSIVKPLTLDDKWKRIELPDPRDTLTINTQSQTAIDWKDMEVLDGGASYMAVIKFNYSVVAAIVDIQFAHTTKCKTIGKYGDDKPTEADNDLSVITKGKGKIVKNRARKLDPKFSQKILKLSITYKGDEAMTTPLILVSKCEAPVSKSKTESNQKNANVIQFRVAEVDLRYFNDTTNNWDEGEADTITLKTGEGKQVSFSSNFFGTFSGDLGIIAPQTIDFESIFQDFLGKLEENPYGLSLLLSLWAIFILITIPLRRLDRSDAELWDYAPLIDNEPSAGYGYYLAVYTAILSAKKFTSAVFINLKGDKNKTGPRYLSDGYRENFRSGTTSHFFLSSVKNLGDLKSMKIWHDNNGKHSKWLLSKIVVGDLRNNKRYVFSCGKWLSLDAEDCKTYRKLMALDEEMVDDDFVFSDLSKRHLFDDHLLFSLSKRPNYSRFTRVQRLWALAALLFLSMITSAMFYNTPNYVGRSIRFGPFTFNYKQFYVGFMSAVIAIIPSIVIMTVFKQRKLKGEEFPKQSTKKKQCCNWRTEGLPWWFIYFGYALIAGCILSSSFFIFMYSLDWGSALTLDWMFAIFFGTAQSILLMEPLKAVCLAVIMTCCCAKMAKNQMAELRFPQSTDSKYVSVEFRATQTTEPCMAWPGDKSETEAERLHKRRLYYNKLLYSKLRSWIYQLTYIAVIIMICSHGEINKAYYQNAHLTNSIQKSYKVNVSTDIYGWIKTDFASSVFSKFHYDGEIKTAYIRTFTEDMYHLRLGLSRIRQVRVHGSCEIPVVIQHAVNICSLEFTSHSEDTLNYCKGWIGNNSTCVDEDSDDSIEMAFLYQTPETTESLAYYGSFGTYGGGGYLIDIGPKYSLAVKNTEKLEELKWIDGSTRAVFVETMLFNANSRLFSHIKVVFEIPHYGGAVDTKIDVTSVNLYPYTESWDYVILGLQVLLMAILLVRLILVFVEIVKTKCSYLITFFGLVRILEIGFGISATVCYIIRIDQTIKAIKYIFLDFGTFVPFEMVVLMDKVYNYCIGALSFIAMIGLLKPLSFNFHLHLMKTSIIISKGKLFAFIFILGCSVMGFASILFVMYGHLEEEFRDIPTSLLSLFRVMIGMVSFKQDIHIDELGVIIIFGLYCFLVTMVLMNLFVSCLNIAFSDATEKVKLSGKHRFESEVNEHLWWKVSTFCGTRDDVEDDEDEVPEEENKNFDSLESNLSKLDLQVVHLFKDSMHTHGLLMKTYLLLNEGIKKIKENKNLRCICRQTRKETQYMYINKHRKFKLVFVFHCNLDAAGIPVEKIKTQDAIFHNVYPDTESAIPYSAMFIVEREDSIKGVGPMDVKIINRSLEQSMGSAFLLSSFDNGLTWEQTAATVPNEMNPCICARLDACPTHFIAVCCVSLFDLPPRVLNNSEYYTLTRSGGVFQSEFNRRIIIQFEPDSVTSDARFYIAAEPSFPSPLIHVLCLKDVKNINVTLPQTDFIPTGKPGRHRDLLVLHKEGCLLKWKKLQTTVRCSNGLFRFTIPLLKRGVKKTILIKTSEIQDPITYGIDDKVFSAFIRKVISHRIAANHWEKIGRMLGITSGSVDKRQIGKRLCSEEKISVVLENWYRRDSEAKLSKLQECLMELNIDITDTGDKD